MFTNYLMFNFNDTPESLYRRMAVNCELSQEHDVAITGFPMRYIPINDIGRQCVSPGWRWKYLRGIQCVLLATRGTVWPTEGFFAAAFGESYKDFLEILAMPDRYIIHRAKYRENRAKDWRKLFRRLTPDAQTELLEVLRTLNGIRDKKTEMKKHSHFRELLEHYYPHGQVLRE